MKPVRRWVVLGLEDAAAVVSAHPARTAANEEAAKLTRESGKQHVALAQIVSASDVIKELNQLRFEELNRQRRNS